MSDELKPCADCGTILVGILRPVEVEIMRCEKLFGAYNSAHEGYGVLAEEFDELLEAIHDNDDEWIAHEANQIAACAARLAEQARQKAWPWKQRRDRCKSE